LLANVESGEEQPLSETSQAKLIKLLLHANLFKKKEVCGPTFLAIIHVVVVVNLAASLPFALLTRAYK